MFHVIVLDSSFLVPYFRPQDENNRKAISIAAKNDNDQQMLPDIILFETLTVLNYKDGIDLAKQAYAQIANNRQIMLHQFDELEKREIVQTFFSENGKVSVADASVIYLAKKTGSGVLAFDEKIVKALKKKE